MRKPGVVLRVPATWPAQPSASAAARAFRAAEATPDARASAFNAVRSPNSKRRAGPLTVAVPPSGPPPTHLTSSSGLEYVLGERLGEGAFATVYLATCRSDGQRYAIKAIDRDHTDVDEATKEPLMVWWASRRIPKGKEIIADYGSDYWTSTAFEVLLAAHE